MDVAWLCHQPCDRSIKRTCSLITFQFSFSFFMCRRDKKTTLYTMPRQLWSNALPFRLSRLKDSSIVHALCYTELTGNRLLWRTTCIHHTFCFNRYFTIQLTFINGSADRPGRRTPRSASSSSLLAPPVRLSTVGRQGPFRCSSSCLEHPAGRERQHHLWRFFVIDWKPGLNLILI